MTSLPGGLGEAETLVIPVLLGLAGLGVAWLRHGRPVPDLLPRPRPAPVDAVVAGWIILACAGFGVIFLVPAILLLAGGEARPPTTALVQGLVFQGSLGLGAFLAVAALARAGHPLPLLPPREVRRSWAGAATEGFLRLLQGFPLLIAAGIAWGGLLLVLEAVGLPVSLAPQDSVRMFDDHLAPATRLGFLLLAVVAAPVAEEAAFRGVMLPLLAGRLRPWAAHLATASAFALVHGHPASFGPLLVLGLVLGRAQAATGDLRVPIFLHAAFNLVSLLRIHLHGSGA